MTTELKFIGGTIIASVVVFAFALFFLNKPETVLSREDVLPSSTSVLGSSTTKMYLVEFSDFECPACALYKPYVDQIMKQYSGSVVFGYRHFPLEQHQHAEYAAYASEAAAKQGKFWEMYDFLFTNQATLSKTTIDQGAKNIGLSMDQYRKDVASEEIKTKVADDKAAALRFGVNATPTFFLNGKKLQLRDGNHLLQIVEEAVKEQQ